MTVRSYSTLAAVGLWLANPTPPDSFGQGPTEQPANQHAVTQTHEPGRLGLPSAARLPTRTEASPNQQLADAVAAQLRQSGQLQNYRVEAVVLDGTVELQGQVADATQRDEVLRLVRAVPGVTSVRDRLAVAGTPAVTRATAVTSPQPLKEPGVLGPGATSAQAPAAGPIQEPTPIFHAPPGLAHTAHNPPPLPPYAWPTFAPYNNYSRVGYPTTYPYQAWPYIGPMYPFPKVPLGWRSIQLTYYDGHWWYGKRATGHDWWRIRYW